MVSPLSSRRVTSDPRSNRYEPNLAPRCYYRKRSESGATGATLRVDIGPSLFNQKLNHTQVPLGARQLEQGGAIVIDGSIDVSPAPLFEEKSEDRWISFFIARFVKRSVAVVVLGLVNVIAVIQQKLEDLQVLLAARHVKRSVAVVLGVAVRCRCALADQLPHQLDVSVP